MAFLIHVLLNPRIAIYVKQLHFDDTWGDPLDATYIIHLSKSVQEHDHTLIAKEDFSLVQSALMRYARPECVNDLLFQLDQGNEESLLALLLCCIPEIQSLHYDRSLKFQQLILKIRTEFSPNCALFQRLKRLRLKALQGDVLRFLEMMMELPALNFLQVEQLDLRSNPRFGAYEKSRFSNVTELNLIRTGFEISDIISLVGAVKNLRRFCFDWGRDWDRDWFIEKTTPRRLCDVLSANAGCSLIKLSLRHAYLACRDTRKLEQYCKLREFVRLTHLDISFDIFCGFGSSTADDIWTCLPRSLETLNIYEVSDDGSSLLCRLLASLWDTWHHYLVNMKTINVHVSSMLTQHFYSMLEGWVPMLNQMGIVLRIFK